MADGIYAKLRILNRPKYDKNKAVFSVIANYVHKTWRNGLLVLNKFCNIYLPGVIISEKIIASFDFQNIGLNINWCAVFAFYKKKCPEFWSRISKIVSDGK